MPRCACASEVYGSVFVCLCVCRRQIKKMPSRFKWLIFHIIIPGKFSSYAVYMHVCMREQSIPGPLFEEERFGIEASTL